MAVQLMYVSNNATVHARLQSEPTDPTAALSSGDPITDATPVMTVQTAAGVSVTGASWPVTMTHSTSGWYAGTSPAAVALVHQTAYKVVVTSSNTRQEIPAVAWNRTGNPPTQSELRVIARAAGLVP